MDEKTLAHHVNSGLSQREIAEREGCSQSNVKHYLKKHGLKTKRANKNNRTCTYCGDKVSKENASRRGKNSFCFTVCKKCHYKQRIERYRNKKKRAVEHKGGSCTMCGYNRCIAALTFHHRNPREKDLLWKNMRSWSFSKIKQELDKCDLLCENCHREVHHLGL